MKDIKELRSAVKTAFEAREAALKEFESADVSDDEDYQEREQKYAEAVRSHERAVDALERREALDEAKKGLPVNPVPDSPEEKRTDAKVGKEPLTYEEGGPHSIFRDMFLRDARSNRGATERLERHMEEVKVERPDVYARALSSTDAAGGYLVSPIYLNDEFIDFLRSGRAAANAIGVDPLPANTDSINVPRMTGGVTVANQADNATLSNTDATFDIISADVKTVGGYEDVAQQLVDRSVPGVDRVIFTDLVRAYNQAFDIAVLNSATANNLGTLQVSGTNSVTLSTATIAAFYPKLADAARQVAEGVFEGANAIIMHTRRWAWLLAGLDSSNRPLIVPNAQGPFNALASNGAGAAFAQGPVGSILGIPVYTDPNIPTTLGASTTEDRVLVINTNELLVWEDQSGPYLDTFRDVLSASLGVRFRLFNYWAQLQSRRPKAISVIAGAGLVAPSF